MGATIVKLRFAAVLLVFLAAPAIADTEDCPSDGSRPCYKKLEADKCYLEPMEEIDDTDISCIVPIIGPAKPILVLDADLAVVSVAPDGSGTIVAPKTKSQPLKTVPSRPRSRSGNADDAAAGAAKEAKFKAGKALADTVK